MLYHDVAFLYYYHGRASPEDAFSASLYQMELDRLRYSLSKYLRTRLRKVERDALHVLATADGEMQGRLSDRYVPILHATVPGRGGGSVVGDREVGGAAAVT